MRNEWRKLRPNILLFHLINPDGTQKPYEEMAEIADYIGTQVMLPMRHQGICPEFGPLWGKKYDIADYVEAVNSILKERGSSARMISQKKGQWYRVYTGFDEI